MSWDKKRGTVKRYFYRSVRLQGRPRKLYAGAGDGARRLAEADLAARLERAKARQAWLQRWAQIEEAQLPLKEFCELAALLLKGALLVSGLHRHGGEWRKRRLIWPTNFR